MSELVITVPDNLRRALEHLAEHVHRRLPLMKTISEDMLAAVQENFEQEGRPRWLPIHRVGEILRASSHLYHSIDADYDNDEAVVGTNVVYARIHNEGGTTRPHVIRAKDKRALYFNGRFAKQVNHPGSRIPARRFLSMTDDDYDGIREDIHDYLDKGLEE
ncbi:phage virion morphogenesis protein [Serratia marcescens]|uniref:Phage virion morphogenesis protein n=1 Tax=Serratia marcescens TaxID=615 RepID=A0A5C7C2S7_SERMA|nr:MULTISPECIES: phage virion morphogenesis protein [Serratia]TXE27145.1 phage virion morphogenesis protein [Serratia marcescens]TXE55298.1 phage virion morphogenesis protein [Serratia marcescens]